ncbi:MAG: hypothetical protein V1747_04070 [Candidatus Omnitrophota bacterium]
MCSKNKNSEQLEPAKNSEGQENNHPSVGKPNASSEDSTDGRKRYDWKTGYPSEALHKIYAEAIFLFIMFFSSLLLIFAAWQGLIMGLFLLDSEQVVVLKKYSYYASSGLLGGVTFGMKYFYRMVARGYWHEDRRMWRIMSPFIATVIALIVGALIDSSMINTKKPLITPAILSLGFLSGYFADEAVGKMYEIANVIFGRSVTTKAGNEK